MSTPAPKPRRDLLKLATWGMGLTAVGYSGWTILGAAGAGRREGPPMVVDIDLSEVREGSFQRIVFDQSPLFVWHQTAAQRQAERDTAVDAVPRLAANNANLDPEATATAANRYYGAFLIVDGRCTRGGCVTVTEAGDFSGFFCPCCASHYDRAGRVRKGPAPRNLLIPPLEVTDGRLAIYRPGMKP